MHFRLSCISIVLDAPVELFEETSGVDGLENEIEKVTEPTTK